MLNEIQRDAEIRMEKSIDTLSQELSKVRTGRAHPSFLKGVVVDYYGAQTPLEQLATIVAVDARTLTVTPFDKNTVAAIEKAIRIAELGLNPSSAGQVIRVPLPPLTEERRRVLTKQMKQETENARVAVRNIRRDANNKLKSLLKQKSISEDEERNMQDKIQKITDKYIEKIDRMSKEKEDDLMKV